MKKNFKFLALTTALIFCAGLSLGAQSIEPLPEISTLSAGEVFSALYEPLYGMLIILSGYLTAYLPGVKKFAPFLRVLAFALVAGVGFHQFGVSFWKVASTYFISSGLYVIFLRNFLKSPQALAG